MRRPALMTSRADGSRRRGGLTRPWLAGDRNSLSSRVKISTASPAEFIQLTMDETVELRPGRARVRHNHETCQKVVARHSLTPFTSSDDCMAEGVSVGARDQRVAPVRAITPASEATEYHRFCPGSRAQHQQPGGCRRRILGAGDIVGTAPPHAELPRRCGLMHCAHLASSAWAVRHSSGGSTPSISLRSARICLGTRRGRPEPEPAVP